MTEPSHNPRVAADRSIEREAPIANPAHAKSDPLGAHDANHSPEGPYPDPDEYADPDAPLRTPASTSPSVKAPAEPGEKVAPPAPEDGESDGLHLLPRGDPEC
jgi:hypothetical protein